MMDKSPVYEAISKPLIKLANMICWLAQKTLSEKDFAEFIRLLNSTKEGEQE